MDSPQPQIDNASIVLVGSFNPQIYQPAWFAAHGILREQEGENAHIQVIHPEVADFTSDWVRIQVTQSRFYAGNTEAGHWQQLMELVVGTFRILEHTPVRALGLNRMMHFSVPSAEVWHRIGDTLAPKDFWRSVMDERPGLGTLVVQGRRPAAESGVLKVKVEPSVRPEMRPYGIYVDTNEHYGDDGQGLLRLLDVLAMNWEPALQHALAIAQGVVRMGFQNGR